MRSHPVEGRYHGSVTDTSREIIILISKLAQHSIVLFSIDSPNTNWLIPTSPGLVCLMSFKGMLTLTVWSGTVWKPGLRCRMPGESRRWNGRTESQVAGQGNAIWRCDDRSLHLCVLARASHPSLQRLFPNLFTILSADCIFIRSCYPASALFQCQTLKHSFFWP